MNEKIDFNEKNKIEELTCDVLIKILDVPHHPRYLSERHKQNSEYCGKFEEEFVKGLSYEQQIDYDSLKSAKMLTSAIEFEYMLLCGMQIKVAMDELIKNPLKILRLYEKIGAPASKLYKSVKQKMEEQNND